MKNQEHGFTLIELLVVILIIGVLSTIAIPVFLNQRKAANDAALKSDIRNIAIQAQTLPVDAVKLAKGIAYTEDTITYFSNDSLRQSVMKTSNGTWWTITGSSAAYCILGYNKNGSEYTDKNPLTYDSTAGGLGKMGAACDPADLVDENGVIIPTGNLIPDPLLTNLNIPQPLAGSLGANGYVQSYFSGLLQTVDMTTPVGNKAVKVITDSATRSQGVIFQQSGKSDAVPVQKAGEKWTTSLYIKAPAGQNVNFGVRVLDIYKNYNKEATSPTKATGDWQRFSYTYTTTLSDVGAYVVLEARLEQLQPGLEMYTAGPMSEKSDTLNPFRVK